MNYWLVTLDAFLNLTLWAVACAALPIVGLAWMMRKERRP